MWRDLGCKMMFSPIVEVRRGSALGEALDLLREFLDLLGFFQDGQGVRGLWVGFFELVLELGNHLIEFRYIGSEFYLVGALNGLGVRAAGLVQAWRLVGVTAVRVNFGLRRSSRTLCFQLGEKRFDGKDADSAK